MSFHPNAGERYFSLDRYLKETFGQKVYKIALQGGMTCPNRDGTCGTKGCIFCSGDGSGEFAQPLDTSVTIQIEKAIKRMEKKTNADRFIAYFQDHSNTYGDIDYLFHLFSEAISHPKVVTLSIATRPDCLENEKIELLEKLNSIKPVWVELGLQTMHEKTAHSIQRGYPLSVFEKAAEALKNASIPFIVHIILGLPNEKRSDMKQTVRYVARSGAFGVKFHLLHILKHTALADEYLQGKISVLTKEEYLDIVTDMIELLPAHMVVHRLTGDAPKALLVAPEWSGNKKDVLNSLRRVLEEKNTLQGRRFS